MLGNRFTALLAKRRNWVIPYVIFMMIFVIAPLFLIVYYAFTDAGGAFSTVNFRKFMIHPEAVNTFVYSVGINTMITPLMMPGMDNGNITFQNTCDGVAPKSCAASIRLLSIFCRVLYIG